MQPKNVLFFLCSLTKGRPSDGFFLNMEDLIRQAIRDFNYPECTIFKQLVQTIAPVEKVSILKYSYSKFQITDFASPLIDGRARKQ